MGNLVKADEFPRVVYVIEGQNICEHRERCGSGVILNCSPSNEDNRCPGLCGAKNMCQKCQHCHLRECDRKEWTTRYGTLDDVDEELDWHELVNELLE